MSLKVCLSSAELMSIVRITLLAALCAELSFGCKQRSEAAPAVPLPAPAPPPVATKLAPAQTPAPGQPAIKPVAVVSAATSPAAMATPPEGMVYVPGGSFDMGPPVEVTESKAPQRVTVAPFFLDRTEVTVAAYLACVKAGGCTGPTHEPGCNAASKKPRLEHPMNCITKTQSEKYCAAQGKRLPTAAEWEFAARGQDGGIYPWGNAAAGEQLCWQGRAGGHSKKTCPVGSFPQGASPFGALDMAGNVAEWTSTEETENEGPGSLFFTRGGSYWIEPLDLAELEELHIRTDQSEPFANDAAIPRIGVRCAKSL
jgi:sulfatase modifying factor 1